MSPKERESAHQRVVSACESARYLVSKVMQDEPLNAEARRQEKQAARQQDVDNLASGRTNQEELREKNGLLFGVIARLLWDKARKW